MLRPPTMATRPSAIQALWCMRRLTLQKRRIISSPRSNAPSRQRIGLKSRTSTFGMRVDRAVVGIAAPGVDVVEEQPDADAAIGSLDDLFGEQAAGEIVLPVVILQVEAAFGVARSGGAQREGLDVVGQEPQPGLAGILRQAAARSPGRARSCRRTRPMPRTAARQAARRNGHRVRPRRRPQQRQ